MVEDADGARLLEFNRNSDGVTKTPRPRLLIFIVAYNAAPTITKVLARIPAPSALNTTPRF